MRTVLVLQLLIALGLCPLACATYREDLNRGQRMYEANQYEHALAIWRVLEEDSDSLSPSDRARYAYLRGMTDYRLGLRADARYWLSLAKATDQAQAGSLSPAWHERLEESLADLNQDVYGAAQQDGGSALAVEYGKAAPGDDAADGGKGAAPATGAASGSEPQAPAAPGGRCRSNADCQAGEMCDGKSCTPL